MVIPSTRAGLVRQKKPRRSLGRRRPRNAVAANGPMFFESPSIRDLLQFLTVALGQAVPSVFLLVGESGIGKSMLLRALQTRLLATDRAVVFHRCAADLARCEEQLGSIADPALAAEGIYLIDGAESWDEESAAWIDGLFKRAVAGSFAARIVIAGRSEAEARLRRLVSPVLASTAAFTRLQLEPIPRACIHAFIHHRLPQTLAGPRPLSPEVLQTIAESSAGIPRRIVEQASAMMEAALQNSSSGGGPAREARGHKLVPIAGTTAAMLTIAAALLLLIRPGAQVATELPSRADAAIPAPPAALASAPPTLEIASATIDDPVAVEPYEPSAGSEPWEALIAPVIEGAARAVEADEFAPETVMPLLDMDTLATDGAIAAGTEPDPVAVAMALAETALAMGTVESRDEQAQDPEEILAVEPVMALPDLDTQATDNAIAAGIEPDPVAVTMALAETALALATTGSEAIQRSVEPSPTPILIEEDPVFPGPAIIIAVSPAILIAEVTGEISQPTAPPIPLDASPMRPARPPTFTAQTIALRRRGDELLQTGDISAARLLFERAARGGDVDAMISLARSYEAATLRELGVVGPAPDPERARLWRERAAEAGALAETSQTEWR